MAIIHEGSVSAEEVSRRIGTLRVRYAGNPLIERIEHRIAPDWSGDPSVFLNVILSRNRQDEDALKNLAKDLRLDLLRVVHTEDIGLHSYLSFVSQS